MTDDRQDELNLGAVERLLGYFDTQVLAAYRNEPHKYAIKSDYFSGELEITAEYYRELEHSGRRGESVDIRFGYRTRKDGNLAIVAWLPDLFEKSKSHIDRWAAFQLKNPEWTTEYDERFTNWVRRYLEGNWEVDNGPSYYLAETIKVINGFTSELVGIPLYKHQPDETLSYPAAENTHRYQDSHKELYGYLIDGLDKACISQLAARLGKNIKVGDKTTVQALKQVFPDLETSPAFGRGMSLVSEQRRLSSHGVRPPTTNFQAFSQFTKDLSLCLEGIKEVLAILEREFRMSGEQAYKRHQAKTSLPKIVEPAQGHFSIVQASRMVGKTVAKVEYGFREHLENVHESEVLIIYFTDGSTMSIETGSNAWNLSDDEKGLRRDDFHVDFVIHWVPELPTNTLGSAS
jgi:hypothetical protein